MPHTRVRTFMRRCLRIGILVVGAFLLTGCTPAPDARLIGRWHMTIAGLPAVITLTADHLWLTEGSSRVSCWLVEDPDLILILRKETIPGLSADTERRWTMTWINEDRIDIAWTSIHGTMIRLPDEAFTPTHTAAIAEAARQTGSDGMCPTQ